MDKRVIPFVFLLMSTMIQGADGGPLLYASCIAGCAAMGVFAPACWPSCLPLLAVPGP